MLTPKDIAKKDSEHAHQSALFAYANVAMWHGFEAADKWADSGVLPMWNTEKPKALPMLKWLHAIPNVGSRGDSATSRGIRGQQLKAEGVKSGVSDVFLPFPVKHSHGLYIEMKRPGKKSTSTGGLSDDQLEFLEFAQENNYKVAVCYSWQEAVMVLKTYLGFVEELELTEQGADTIMAGLSKPAKPNKKALEAAKRYKKE